jgi:signal transduction histidine kinase
MTPIPVEYPAAAPSQGERVPAWLPWLLVPLVWGAVAAMEATQTRVYFDMAEPHHGWADAAQRVVPFWTLWALYTPLAVWMARRLPLDRATLARRLPAHLGVAVTLAVAHAWGTANVAMWIGWPREYDMTFEVLFRKSMTGKLHIQLLIYAAVVGLMHAVEYHRRFRERELAASELQARLAQAQLHALQAQIHPHFLFNTLNAISVLALKGETKCVVRMISRLSELLRVTLERSAAQETTLADELELLGRYLEIERVRFGDRLAVEVDAPDDALDALVPALVLQPLVENAVRHGISEVPGPGRIVVRARRAGGDLRLEVRDTGPGLPAGGVPREGIGLANTRARLSRLYGGAGRLRLANAEGGGTIAAVELPFHRPAAVPRIGVPAGAA